MLTRLILAAILALAAPGALHAQAPVIRITRQPAIIYMPTYVMEAQKLVEKHAAALGAPPVTTEWLTFAGGGNATDAMLAGSIDVVNTGPGNLLLLWDRTKGGVKGIAASSALPLTLISRDPRIKTLRDFTETDRIAVPTIKVSTQAVLLQIAAATMFGPDKWAQMDPNTVQMGHPDALVALTNPRHEVASHFSAYPFSYQELRTVPGAHVVTDDRAIMGGPLSNAVFFATTKFGDANPKLIQAIKDATIEAEAFIRTNPREAIEIYRRGSGDRMTTDELLTMREQPGMDDYRPKPQGTLRLAQHMHRIGTLKMLPKDWTDYFFPISSDLGGN